MKFEWISPAGTLIEFSKDSDTYRLLKAYDGLSIAPITHLTVRSPYQDGATRIDSHFEPREVTIPIMVTAPTLQDLQYAVQALAISLNPLAGTGMLVFTAEDGSEYLLYCIGNVTPAVSPDRRDAGSQLISLNFIAYDPFWYSYPSTMTYFGAGTPLTYPLTYPYEYPAGIATHVITNGGNVASPVTIVISGEIVNPVITRSYTDSSGQVVSEALAFTVSMAAGETMTITTGFGNKTITYLDASGNLYANPFQYLDSGSVFWQLVPGENTVVVTNTSIAAATVTSLETTSRYSGV